MKTSALVPPLTLTKGAAGWLIFSLLLAMSWHIPHTPIWVLAAAPVLVFWRYRLLVQKKPLPPRGLRLVLTLAAFVGVLVTYQSYLGRDPGTTALILLSSLKLFELKTQRDFMFIIFLCYFLVFGNFLYSQDIQALTFMMVAVVLITAAVLRLNHGEKQPVKIKFLVKSGFRFFLLSVPFMVVLFFLFPRTSVPLWNLPQEGEKQAKSGFNDRVRPGQIAELAAVKKNAFRVSFPDGNMPAPRDLYFRGLVLWFTDGKGWFQGVLRSTYRRRRFQEEDETTIQQTFTLEPHNARWLFGLDTPVVIPRGARILPGRIFQSNWPISKIIRYGVVSSLQPKNPESLSRIHKRWALQLPSDRESRLIDLGRSWGEEAASDAAVVQRALDHFRDSDFTYTLRPGAMDEEQPLEDFFFNKRQGFCEHYAAAFALLMRGAGVPTRMVLGYQGGEYNTVGEYLLVRQSDAHAWCEVWLEGEGWKRVDPTAAVSPERVEYGMDISSRMASMRGSRDDDGSDAVQRAMRRTFLRKVLRFLEQHWDNINNKWDLWIMTYDRFRQRDILRALGLSGFNRWSLLVVLLIVVPTLFYAISLLLKRQTTVVDPLVKYYRLFHRKTAKIGVKPAPWEGPLDFRLRAVDALPHRAKTIHQIIDLYINLRFGKLPVTRETLKQFKRLVKKFKLQGRDSSRPA
jgi:hypothetical protein